ncbi:MAG: protein kinase domain-containing protein [Planctomycetia bacterium]
MFHGDRTDDSGDAAASRLTGSSDPFGFVPDEIEELPAGTDVGGLRIVRLVGEGGMGRVYEAEQEAPRRTVAVKFMRGGLVSPAAVRRFEREADVLARLRHPHVAQIHAVGTLVREGLATPYLVIEFIPDALTITRHAIERGLTVRERVRLFRLACAAVAHGHASGVIQRDLQPGTILVGSAGRPKVIDFGIAHAATAGDTVARTAAGELLGTLDSMSPEQLGAVPGDPAASVDARTDVYALGLVLRDLLAGESTEMVVGLLDAPRIIASRSERGRAAVARACGRDPSIRVADAKSLAAVVGKCLEPLPAGRYDSAAELAADLDRWLADEPTRARPPAWHESARRWARRHRAAAVAAFGIASAAAIGLVVSGAFYAESVGQRRVAEEQLYLATVARAADASDRDNVADAVRLLSEARSLARTRATADRPAREPIELACLAALLDDSVDMLPGHAGGLATVAVSADGAWAVTGGVDGTARVWRLGDRGNAAVVLRGHEKAIWGIGFSPDAKMVATGGADKTVRLWESATGRPLATLRGHTGTVYSVEFTPDGRSVLSGARDKTVRLWDVATRQTTRVFTGHEGTVYSVAITGDGARMATASLDKTVRLWNLSTGDEEGRLEGHAQRVFSVAFSRDAARLATASLDGTARLWDAGSCKELARLEHPVRVNAVAFSPDGRFVATAAGDTLLRIWNTADGREVRRMRGHEDWIWAVAALPEHNRFLTASADATARVFDIADGDAIMRSRDRVLTVAFDRAGGRLAVGSADGGLAVWDAATCRERVRKDLAAGRVNGVSFSPDGGLLAAACDEAVVLLTQDADGLRESVRLEGTAAHRGRVHSAVFSAGGEQLLTASADKTARLWNIRARREVARFRHPRRVFAAAFSPDGSRVATACEDARVRFFPVGGGDAVAELAGHGKQVNWLAFAPDGSALATVSSDATARIWPLSRSGEVRGREPRVLQNAAAQLWKVDWSPDSSRLAAASADGGVHLWDAASGQQLMVLRGHADEVWAVAFAPDGATLCSGSDDRTTRMWGLAPAALAARRF